MVENLAESPGMRSDGPGSAPNEIPKRELFSLSGSKMERKKRIGSGLGKEKGWLLDFILWPGSHPREARAAGPRHPRGQSARRADRPDPRHGQSIITSRTTSEAPPSDEPRGQSALPWRTVRQEQPDGPPYCCGRSDLLF
jgi:hypothetical protein